MKFIKIIVVFFLILFASFWVWYEYNFSMDTVIPYKVNNPNMKTKVLIASQGSRFKDSLVRRVLTHYENDSIHFKVIDVYTLFTVSIDKWDAVLIINSWEYGSPPRNVKKYINKYPDKLDKLVVVSTVGSSHISLEDVDVISGESILEKLPDYTTVIVNRLETILNHKKTLQNE